LHIQNGGSKQACFISCCPSLFYFMLSKLVLFHVVQPCFISCCPSLFYFMLSKFVLFLIGDLLICIFKMAAQREFGF
jgi:hypothetical protein